MKRIVVLVCFVVIIGGARHRAQGVLRGSHGAAGAGAPAIREPPHGAIRTAAGRADFKAHTAFREYAAKTLKVTPAEIEGGSINAATARAMPNSVGNAWAFTMWLKSDRRREVRGWATPGGAVIAPDQNLGILFAEAGAWDGKRDQRQNHKLAGKLATLVVWAYGMNHAVAGDVGQAPSLELNGEGGGRLRFISSYRAPGGDSAFGGPKTYTENVIALTSDRRATLTKTPYHR